MPLSLIFLERAARKSFRLEACVSASLKNSHDSFLNNYQYLLTHILHCEKRNAECRMPF